MVSELLKTHVPVAEVRGADAGVAGRGVGVAGAELA